MTLRNTLIASSLLLACGSALAETRPLTFEVEAEIRNDTFMILPQGEWNLQATRLIWRPDLSLLESAIKTIYVKSNIGEVSAYLDALPTLRSGASTIPMKISIGNAQLGVGTTNKITIAAATDAAAGMNLPLEIAAPAPTGGYTPGYYNGAVNLTFESVAPV